MNENNKDYFDLKGKFNERLYVSEVTNGLNKMFDEILGKYTCAEISNIVLSYDILKHDYDNIFKHKNIGCVYFVTDKKRNLTKIGMSQNFNKRFKNFIDNYRFCGLDETNLSVSGIVFMHKIYIELYEKKFHSMFSENHNYLEWFNITQDEVISNLSKYAKTNGLKTINKSHSIIIVGNKIFNENKYKNHFNLWVADSRLNPFNKRPHQKFDLGTYNNLYDILMEEVEKDYLEHGTFDFETIIKRLVLTYKDYSDVLYKYIMRNKIKTSGYDL